MKISPNIERQKGIVLIIVLWVLTILMVIAMSFSVMTRTETHATLGFREGLDKKFLAEAGIERAIIELFYRNTYKNQEMLEEEKKVWEVHGKPYTLEMPNGQIILKIIDESGKIDINNLNDLSGIILKNLLINMGVPEQEALTIVDSILDWKDADDLRRLNGAEKDYYMSLPKPYKAKDSKFDTLEELLLVKGMTPDILFGSYDKNGIYDFITIYANTNTINLRSAPKEVLLAVPGLTPEIVDEIISKREGLIATKALDVVIPQESEKFVNQQGSLNVFTIESRGYKAGEKSAYTIKTTVILEGNNKIKYLYYKSPANVRK